MLGESSGSLDGRFKGRIGHFRAALALESGAGLQPFVAWWQAWPRSHSRAETQMTAGATHWPHSSRRSIGNRRDQARARMLLGMAALSRGEHGAAVAQLTSALMDERELR
jgi:hypothetical protein